MILSGNCEKLMDFKLGGRVIALFSDSSSFHEKV